MWTTEDRFYGMHLSDVITNNKHNLGEIRYSKTGISITPVWLVTCKCDIFLFLTCTGMGLCDRQG